MAKFTVHLFAFTDDGTEREVEVPDEINTAPDTDAELELIFKYGQNDFQPKPLPSVSMGDVIELRGTYWYVAPFGFRDMTFKEVLAYRRTPRRDRAFFFDERTES